MSENKKKPIIVTLNYDNWRKIPVNVPEEWSDLQIVQAINKRYGEIDILKWEHAA